MQNLGLVALSDKAETVRRDWQSSCESCLDMHSRPGKQSKLRRCAFACSSAPPSFKHPKTGEDGAVQYRKAKDCARAGREQAKQVLHRSSETNSVCWPAGSILTISRLLYRYSDKHRSRNLEGGPSTVISHGCAAHVQLAATSAKKQ